MVEIAHVRAGDARSVQIFAHLLAQYEESLPLDLRISDLEAELQSLPERYAPPAAAMLLALDNETAVGCVAIKALDSRTAEIKRLYVAPGARRSGAGRALVGAAIAFARERSCERVVLDTERERLNAAYRLYVSLGFRHCAPYAQVDYANPTFMELTFRA